MNALQPASTPRGARGSEQGWSAELELGFAVVAGRTALVHNRHVGPLTVQRPFYPEGELAHVYLLHPPGGIVAGDRSRWTWRAALARS